MKSILACCLLAGIACAQDEGIETLRAEIGAMRPERQSWSGIDWKGCPLEAIGAARKAGKPILVWVFLGDPSDERC